MLKNKAYLFTFILLTGALLYWIQAFRIKEDAWKQVVASDGRGYYAYLPAAFIYNDWDWKFVDAAEKAQFGQDFHAGSWLNEAHGHKVNQYFVGTSIMIMPFFLLAMALSPMFGYPVDGYSFLFQHSVVLAGVFYFILGLYWLKKTLETYGLSKRTIILTLICFGLGTNLYYYAAFEPSMSHVYSFAMVAGFCYYVRKLLAEYSRKDLIILTVILGLIILIRPVNIIIILFIPFLAGSLRGMVPFFKNIFSHKKHLFTCIGIITGMGFIQLFVYYLQTGHFLVYSYSSAGFNFASAHFAEILFSFRKGLFVYTPITFLSLYGLARFVPGRAFSLFSWLAFFVACTYLLSSWDFWWYGGSFGLRAYIEFFPCFAIPFAFLFEKVSLWRFGFMTALSGLLVWLNIIQSYQYQKGILLGDGMNREKYWAVFLKTEDKLNWALYNESVQQVMENACFYDGTCLYQATNNFETILPAWGNRHTRMSYCPAPSGDTVSHINEQSIFSETFAMSFDTLGYDSALVLGASAIVYASGEPSAVIVISVENGDSMRLWHSRRITSIVDPRINQWNYVSTSIPFPDPRKGDVLKVYMMKEGPGGVNIDNLSVTILKKK